MTIAVKTLFTSLLFVGALGVTAAAQAQEGSFPGGELSANISMHNDYRFRGVSQNNEGFALQGGFDYSHDSGFYVGTWASNISDYNGSTVETDIYGGYAGEKNGLTYDIGGLLYHYPGGNNTDYVELYGSTGIDLGFVSAKIGANYAFSRANLNNRDNIYIYTDGEAAVPNTPVMINFHLGYENGAFATKKWDWILGASINFHGLDLGVSYIDTNIAGKNTSATVVFSVGSSF